MCAVTKTVRQCQIPASALLFPFLSSQDLSFPHDQRRCSLETMEQGRRIKRDYVHGSNYCDKSYICMPVYLLFTCAKPDILIYENTYNQKSESSKNKSTCIGNQASLPTTWSFLTVVDMQSYLHLGGSKLSLKLSGGNLTYDIFGFFYWC